MPREKYANKSKVMRFVHKNTGYLVVTVFLLIAAVIYFTWDDERLFFETWSCTDINNLALEQHNTLTINEHGKLHELLTDCDIHFKGIKHGV